MIKWVNDWYHHFLAEREREEGKDSPCPFEGVSSPCSSSFVPSLFSERDLFVTSFSCEEGERCQLCHAFSSEQNPSSPSLSLLRKLVKIFDESDNPHLLIEMIQLLLESLPVERGESSLFISSPSSTQEKKTSTNDVMFFCVKTLSEHQRVVASQDQIGNIVRLLIIKHQHLCSLPSSSSSQALSHFIPTNFSDLGTWLVQSLPGLLSLRFLHSYPHIYLSLLTPQPLTSPSLASLPSVLASSLWEQYEDENISSPFIANFLESNFLSLVRERRVEELIFQQQKQQKQQPSDSQDFLSSSLGLVCWLKGTADCIFEYGEQRKRKASSHPPEQRSRGTKRFKTEDGSSLSVPPSSILCEEQSPVSLYSEKFLYQANIFCEQLRRIHISSLALHLPQVLLSSLRDDFLPLLKELLSSPSLSPFHSQVFEIVSFLSFLLIKESILDYWDVFSLFILPLLEYSQSLSSPSQSQVISTILSHFFLEPPPLSSFPPLSLSLPSLSSFQSPPHLQLGVVVLRALCSLYHPLCLPTLSPSSLSSHVCPGISQHQKSIFSALSHIAEQCVFPYLSSLPLSFFTKEKSLAIMHIICSLSEQSLSSQCLCSFSGGFSSHLGRFLSLSLKRERSHPVSVFLVSFFLHENEKREKEEKEKGSPSSLSNHFSPKSLIHLFGHYLVSSLSSSSSGEENFRTTFSQRGSLFLKSIKSEEEGGEREREILGKGILHWLKSFLSSQTFDFSLPPLKVTEKEIYDDMFQPFSLSLPLPLPSHLPLTTPLFLVLSHFQDGTTCPLPLCFCHSLLSKEKPSLSFSGPDIQSLEHQTQNAFLSFLSPFILSSSSLFRGDKELVPLILDHFTKFLEPLEERTFRSLLNPKLSPRPLSFSLFLKIGLLFRLRLLGPLLTNVCAIVDEEQMNNLVIIFLRLYIVVSSQVLFNSNSFSLFLF